MKKRFAIISCVALMSACNQHTGSNKTENVVAEAFTVARDTLESPLRPNEQIMLGETYTDTVEFINLNDEGDHALFIIRKEKNPIRLIYDWHHEYTFIKGDQVEIVWKTDSIRYAGDPEFIDYTEFLVSAKRLEPPKLTDKKIEFLWRETQYDEALEADINAFVLNQEFIAVISEPEKAALAYAATFIGNGCEWDGKASSDRSNLKCKILWALGLGYQCSQQHLDFLRYWFRNDTDVIVELENCPTTPDGATIQDTFDEINLTTEGNLITVFFKASGINLREGKSWNWTETHYFDFKENELRLVKKDVSPVQHKVFEVRAN